MTASDTHHQPTSRSLADQALDVLVYAPAGVLITAVEDLPGMAAKGRARLDQQLRNAQVVGRFAVGMGWRQLQQRIASVVHREGGEPGEPAGPPVHPPAPAQAGGSAGARGTGVARVHRAQGTVTGASATVRSTSGTVRNAGGSISPVHPPEAEPEAAPGLASVATPGHASVATPDPAVDRAIPDYDTLSASQVVRRLGGLGPDELRAVIRHELATRSRRSIVNRAEQLLGEPPSSLA